MTTAMTLFDRLHRRFNLVHGHHKRIAAGVLWVGLFVMIVKLCVAAREAAIAWRYGTSAVVDAYQLALTVTTWLPMLCTGVMSLVLVPRLIVIREQPDAYRPLIRELNGTLLMLGLLMVAATWLLAPIVVSAIIGRDATATARMAETLARSLAPVSLLMLVAGYLAARLQARERFAYTLGEALPALIILLFVIVPFFPSALAPLIWGTLIGFAVQMLWMMDLARRSEGSFRGLSFRRRSSHWRDLYLSFALMAAGQLFTTLSIPIDQAFAAVLGEGAIATLSYATRLVTLITSLAALVLGRALLPVISTAIAEKKADLARQQMFKWAGLMLLIATVISLISWWLAPLAVQILFERGAFTARDTDLVTEAFRYGLLQLPPFFAGMVLVQWFAATRRHKEILVLAFAGLVAKLIANAWLVGPLGLGGIMIGSALMYMTTTLMMLAGAWRRGGRS